MPPALPPVGAIERGTVQRIESYGAFVGLENYRLRGLIHISQLANYKVEQVEDAVSVNDIVYIKILDVEIDPQGRPKIRLSLKDASQDGTCQDLGQEREQSTAISQQIQQNLQSSIGMGVAIDPMAHLIFKSVKQSTTLINGYALVDDMEGESIIPIPAVTPRVVPVVPMGRGRGTTLPAWMTQSNGPAPIKEDRHQRSKHVKKEKKTKRHKHDDEVKRKRTRDQSFSDNESQDSRHRRKHRHRRRRSPHNGRNDNENEFPSRRRTRRRSRSHSNDGDQEFGSVDAAKRLIAELEAKNAIQE